MEEWDNIKKVEEQSQELTVEQAAEQTQRYQNAKELKDKIGCADCP